MIVSLYHYTDDINNLQEVIMTSWSLNTNSWGPLACLSKGIEIIGVDIHSSIYSHYTQLNTMPAQYHIVNKTAYSACLKSISIWENTGVWTKHNVLFCLSLWFFSHVNCCNSHLASTYFQTSFENMVIGSSKQLSGQNFSADLVLWFEMNLFKQFWNKIHLKKFRRHFENWSGFKTVSNPQYRPLTWWSGGC